LALEAHHRLTETTDILVRTLCLVPLPLLVVEQDTLVGLMLIQMVALAVVVVHSLDTHQELVLQVKVLQVVLVTLVLVQEAVVLVLLEQMLVQELPLAVTVEVEPLQVLLVHQLAMQAVVVVLVM
jgi:hypothetical protein